MTTRAGKAKKSTKTTVPDTNRDALVSDSDSEAEKASVGGEAEPTHTTTSATTSTSQPVVTTSRADFELPFTSFQTTSPFSTTTPFMSSFSSQPVRQPLENVLQAIPKQKESISSNALVDIPPVYLYDRSNWFEFKKILNECGGTWNIPHWMTTIVRGGEEWKNLKRDGMDVDAYFPKPSAAAEGKHVDLASRLVASLGLPKNIGDTIRNDVQYCCLSTVEVEDNRRLPARQKMWAWLTKSLKGTRTAVGPYYYIIDEVQAYDIAALFGRLVKVLEQITICYQKPTQFV